MDNEFEIKQYSTLLKKFSINKLKRLLRCTQDSGISKNMIIAKLIAEMYFNKSRIRRIKNITPMFGGVYTYDQISKNNKKLFGDKLGSNLPWLDKPRKEKYKDAEKIGAIDKLKEDLKKIYGRIGTDDTKMIDGRSVALDKLMKLESVYKEKNYAINMDFLDNYYKYFYIGLEYFLHPRDVCNAPTYKKSDVNLQRDPKKKLASGAAGEVSILTTKDDRYELILKKMLEKVPYRKEYLSLEVLHWTNTPKSYKFYNRYGQLPYSKRTDTWANWNSVIEDKFSDNKKNKYKKLNAFNVAGHKDELVTLSVPSDNFTNQTILHMILNKILTKSGIDNFIYQYDAYYCKRRPPPTFKSKIFGYNIIEKADADLFNHIKTHMSNILIIDNNYEKYSAIFKDMFKQVLKPLYILQKPEYAFVHSDLKTKNIFVKYEPISDSDYNNLKLDEQYTIIKKNGTKYKVIYKIADYDKSSITWNGIRFYNQGGIGISSVYLATELPTLLDYSEKNNKFYDNSKQYSLHTIISAIARKLQINVPGFRPTSEMLQGIETSMIGIRYSPVPFYSSIDVYTFFISVLYTDTFYNYIKYCEEKKQDDPIFKMFKTIFPIELTRIKLLTGAEIAKNANKTLDTMGQIIFELYRNDVYPLKNIDSIYNLFNIDDKIFNYTDKQRDIVEYVNLTPKNNKLCRSNCGTFTGREGNYVNYDKIPGVIIEKSQSFGILPIENGCKTNRYTKFGLAGRNIYDWDYCGNKNHDLYTSLQFGKEIEQIDKSDEAKTLQQIIDAKKRRVEKMGNIIGDPLLHKYFSSSVERIQKTIDYFSKEIIEISDKQNKYEDENNARLKSKIDDDTEIKKINDRTKTKQYIKSHKKIMKEIIKELKKKIDELKSKLKFSDIDEKNIESTKKKLIKELKNLRDYTEKNLEKIWTDIKDKINYLHKLEYEIENSNYIKEIKKNEEYQKYLIKEEFDIITTIKI